MSTLMVHQLQHESDAWKRLLEFMETEDNFLLSRLAGILKERQDIDFLDYAEHYQDRLLAELEKIRQLRGRINRFDRELLLEMYLDGAVDKKVNTGFRKIRNEVAASEKRFNRLQKQFNDYLTSITL